MRATMHRTLLTAALLLPMLAACSDSPVQPEAESSAPYARQFYFGQEKFSVLQRVHATSGSTVSGKVGASGGVLSAGGMVLVIPPRALAADITITMTVPAGDALSVEFQPHGLQFSRPATLGFLLNGTPFENRGGENELVGVYHSDPLTATEVTPREIMNVRVSNNLATFGVWHFSRYSIATTRTGLILVGG